MVICEICKRKYKCKCQKPVSVGELEVRKYIQLLLPNENMVFNKIIKNMGLW